MSTRWHATSSEIAFAERHFDFLLPSQKRLLTSEEVSAILRRSRDFVLALVDGGQLESHQDSALGTGNRLSNRITRRSLLVHLARTCTGSTEDYLPGLTEAAKTMPGEYRAKLIHSLLGGCSADELTHIIRTATDLRTRM